MAEAKRYLPPLMVDAVTFRPIPFKTEPTPPPDMTILPPGFHTFTDNGVLKVTIPEYGNTSGIRDWVAISQATEMPDIPIYEKNIVTKPLRERVEEAWQYNRSYVRCMLDGSVPNTSPNYPAIFAQGSQNAQNLALHLGYEVLKDVEVARASARLNQCVQIRERYKAAHNNPNHRRLVKGSVLRDEEKQLALQQKRIDSHKQTVRVQEILRETALDTFIHQYFLVPQGIEHLKDALKEMDFNGHDILPQLNTMLTQASGHINSLKDIKKYKEYVQLFTYKDGSENINLQNNHLLTTLVKEAFAPPHEQVDTAVGTVARDLLDLFMRMSVNMAPTKSEKSPFLAFVYDYFFAAASPQNPELLKNASMWISDRFKKQPYHDKYIQEYHDAKLEEIAETKTTYTMLETERKKLGINDIIMLVAKPPSQLLLQVDNSQSRSPVGKYYDRLSSFEVLTSLLEVYGVYDLGSEAIANWTKIRDAYMTKRKRVGETANQHFERTFFEPFIGDKYGVTKDVWETVQDWVKTCGMMNPTLINLNTLITTLLPQSTYVQVVGKPEASLEVLQQSTFGFFPEEFQNYAKMVGILLYSFAKAGPNPNENFLKRQEENAELVRKIRQESMWFVAPNGDRFSVVKKQNSDLQQYHISSITYQNDPSYSGHKIDVAFDIADYTGAPITISMYMDRNGNLYDEKRRPVILPIWIDAEFKHLLLNRLNFIMSGAMSQSGKIKTHEGERDSETKKGGPKRAHWRYYLLKGRSSQPITLLSEAAQKHKEIVLERYGLDIMQENINRRRATKVNQLLQIKMEHPLSEGEAMTWVIESENTTGKPPNELRFMENYTSVEVPIEE